MSLTDDEPQEFDFYSERFRIDSSEVEETNPYMYGRELAHWLSGQLLQKGYRCKVVSQDWGWSVSCQRKPFILFVACISALDENLIERCEDASATAPILWRMIPVAEKSIVQRFTNKEDIEPRYRKLREDVLGILKSEPSVRFATRQEIDEWQNNVFDLVDGMVDDVYQPKPVSRWISVPISVLLLPILLVSGLGAASLLFDNPEEYAIVRPVVGTVLLLLIVPLGYAVIRVILGKQRPVGSLFPPAVLRAFSILFFLLPIGGLFTGWYVEHPVTGTAQAITYYVISTSLWRLAKRRTEKLERLRERAER